MISSDPSLTAENLAPVMALVDPHKWKVVWSRVLPKFLLELESDIHLPSHTATAYYVKYWLNASWKEVHAYLYEYEQTAALEKVKPFLPSVSSGMIAVKDGSQTLLTSSYTMSLVCVYIVTVATD